MRNEREVNEMFPNLDAEQGRKKINNTVLADMLGVDRKTLSNWKKKGTIPADALLKMSKIFNCSTDYLVGRTDSKN